MTILANMKNNNFIRMSFENLTNYFKLSKLFIAIIAIVATKKFITIIARLFQTLYYLIINNSLCFQQFSCIRLSLVL